MATYTEAKRSSDAYRKDDSKKSINHDKPGGKTTKISTDKLKKFDKQCYH